MQETKGQSRAEAVRTERRRKPGSETNAGIHLSVDESKLDRANYHYRFVNDTPGRVQRLYSQDYDVVQEAGVKPDSTGLGSVSSVQAGVEGGKPFDAVLMRKPRHMHDEDQKLKQKPLDEQEAAIRRGDTARQNVELKGDGVYTPDGVNIIERV